jgi:RNA polymerase sigma-70 factor (ECF subfamily)
VENTPPSAASGLSLSLGVPSPAAESPGSGSDESPPAGDTPAPTVSLSPRLLDELWRVAGAERYGVSPEEFACILDSLGTRVNFGLPADHSADATQRAAFFRALHLEELALAQACALGREPAWESFLQLYRAPLLQAAIAITNSASLGEELADALYAQLYGLREQDGQRRCPLASYSGRGSLMGWLRTTLVQRYRDHYRRTRHETPLGEIDSPAPEPSAPVTAELALLSVAVTRILQSIDPAGRFLLAAYFLDRQTLLQIACTLEVHEATVSRRLKRLVTELRKKLIDELRVRGLSKAAAEEALGADPRDIEINLRAVLQTSQAPAFSQQKDSNQAGASEES